MRSSSLTSNGITVDVRYIDDGKGFGAFAKTDYAPGDVILVEQPVVFAQSYMTWKTAPASAPHQSAVQRVERNEESAQPVCSTDEKHALHCRTPAEVEMEQQQRCCFGCGAPLLAFLPEELNRLDQIYLSTFSTVEKEGRSGEQDGMNRRCSSSSCCAEVVENEVDATPLSALIEEEQHGGFAPSITLTAAEAAGLSRPYRVELDICGDEHVVYFCTAACEARGLIDDGKRFVVEKKTGAVPPDGSHTEDDTSLLAIRYPSYDDILHYSSIFHEQLACDTLAAAWPTPLYVLSTLHSLSRRCNERVWFIVLLLAKQLHQAIAVHAAVTPDDASLAAELNCPEDDESVGEFVPLQVYQSRVALPLKTLLNDMIDDYAEGAMEPLVMEQRCFLRYSWRAILWWLMLSSLEELTQGTGASGKEAAATEIVASSHPLKLEAPLHSVSSGWIRAALRILATDVLPLGLYLQLYWLTNANAHMYIVANPLATYLNDSLTEELVLNGDAVPEMSSAPSPSSWRRQRLQYRLYQLFYEGRAVQSPWQSSSPSPPKISSLPCSVYHSTGVALYKTASRFNHSCQPNVRFQPNTTKAGVAALVVALRDISCGEELFTSYIDVHSFTEATANETNGGADEVQSAHRRRCYLEQHYGFRCRCPRCAVLDESNQP